VGKLGDYEIALDVNKVPTKYIDAMVIALYHSGYETYQGMDGELCFKTYGKEVTEIKVNE